MFDCRMNAIMTKNPSENPESGELRTGGRWPMDKDPLPEVSTVELLKSAIEESQQLLKAEIALARHEATREIGKFKFVAIAAGIAVTMLLLSLAMLLVAAVLAIGPYPQTALITAAVLFALAAAAGGVGYSLLPKKPVAQTQEDLKADVRTLKASLT